MHTHLHAHAHTGPQTTHREKQETGTHMHTHPHTDTHACIQMLTNRQAQECPPHHRSLCRGLYHSQEPLQIMQAAIQAEQCLKSKIHQEKVREVADWTDTHQEPTDAGCMKYRNTQPSKDWMRLPIMTQNIHICNIAVSKKNRNHYSLTKGLGMCVCVRVRQEHTLMSENGSKRGKNVRKASC